MRRYVVTRTQEVQVNANTAKDAGAIAAAAYENGQNADNGVINGPNVMGNTTSSIRTVGLFVEEAR